MTKPLISVLHPTRRVAPSEAFPSGWQAAFREWASTCDGPSRVEYVIAVHESRWEEFWRNWQVPADQITEGLWTLSGSTFGSVLIVRNSGRDCAVDQINCAAAASSGLLLIGAQDDLFPPEHWDTLALEALLKYPIQEYTEGDLQRCCGDVSEYVIRCSSGSPRDKELTIAAFGSRSRYERMGYCLSPEFDGMFADNYFDFELRRDEKAGLVTVIERPDIQFDHRHPIFNKGTMDESYAQQNAARNYRQGFATFKRLTEGTRVVALCFPGESFSHWVCSSIVKLVAHLIQGPRFIPEDYWFHSSNVYSTRIELAAHVLGGEGIEGVGSKPDLVYWQDDDNPVSPEHFEMLLATLDAHPDYGIVTGWCWCDTGDYEHHPFRMSCGRQGPELECKFFSVEDYLRMKAASKNAITTDDVAPDALWSGFPVVLMRGSVLEQLGWESFKPMLGNYRRGFTSEDTTFFYRAHQAGIKSAVDLRVKVPHVKLRAIEPQIVPAADREKYLEFLHSAEEKLKPQKKAADGPHGMVDSLETVTA